MATYVLVPGAWLGGWAWHDVAARLRAGGHEVYPITLTGLGERAHLARPEVDLETHIADIVNTILWNDLQEVILAGHSYGGIPVTGAADRLPERLRALVFVDSAPMPNGMAMVDLFPPERLAELQRIVDDEGDGWRLPFPGFAALGEDASLAGVSEADRERMAEKAVAQPWGSYMQPLRLDRAGEEPPYRQVVIACADVRGMVAPGVPPIVAMTRPPWHYLELETGHWPMFSEAAALAELLAGLAVDDAH
jgi:pimeloyl-ACP methyl ester carboxylesterase